MTDRDVAEVKQIVDEIVRSILGLMNSDAKKRTERYILSQPTIPIFVSEKGSLRLGTEGDGS